MCSFPNEKATASLLDVHIEGSSNETRKSRLQENDKSNRASANGVNRLGYWHHAMQLSGVADALQPENIVAEVTFSILKFLRV